MTYGCNTRRLGRLSGADALRRSAEQQHELESLLAGLGL